ncbi:ArsR family transcriptional regulator, partial [Streptomyces nigra]
MLRTPVNETRLAILEWLRDPVAHFPARRGGDPVED